MRRLVVTTCMLGGALLAVANSAAAQVLAAAPAEPSVRGRIGVDLLTSSLGGDAATASGTGVRGWGFLMNGGADAGVFTATADLGIQDVADNEAFTQNTTGGEMTSGVTLITESVEAGLRIPPHAVDPTGRTKISAGANVGYSLVQARRGIANCSDCHVEHLTVDGGAFVEPVVSVHHGASAFSARIRFFQGGADLRNAFIVGWSYTPSLKRAKPVTTAPSPGTEQPQQR